MEKELFVNFIWKKTLVNGIRKILCKLQMLKEILVLLIIYKKKNSFS
jgi:hypothetical protein